ncbi:mucin-5B-like [Drosophila tropicalis]|uniref:mucin-5B-like n=1 Tax=Drosophila tropicalis TaxID=46794 RepID=UPI0035ABB76C
MMLTMRRQNELGTAATSATSSPPPSNPTLSLVQHTALTTSGVAPLAATLTPSSPQDSLNTPTTPQLGLSRNPLQFTPPAPPIAVQTASSVAPTFGFYQGATTTQAAALPIRAHPPPPSSLSASDGIKESSNHGVELDEYVDILQVQQLLLDTSAAAAAAANQNSNNPPTSAAGPVAVDQLQQQQSPLQQPQSQQQPQVAKPRPRINLQKTSEYAAQLAQAETTSSVSAAAAAAASRRVLLDYPNPYLYGNHHYHHHTSPSEDLVALWFGSNGTESDMDFRVGASL